jgi:uncharacterized phage protein gp47/JayE
MKVLDRETIQSRLMLNMRARDSEITYFGPGPIRAFFYAIAVELQHLYYRMFRADLKQDPLRAVGTDLDEIGQARGVTRLGASQSSAILTFTGTIGTLVPSGFQVRSLTGQIYTTLEAKTVAADSSNPGATGIIKVVAQSVNSGATSAAATGTITQIVSFASITGGTLRSVTNEAASVGGVDAETDDQYRSRVVHYLASLNQGTRAFYTAAVRTADSTVVRTIVGRTGDPHTVKLLVVSRSGATYSGGSLSSIAAAIGPQIPVLATVSVENIMFTTVDISFTGTIKSGYVTRDVIEQVVRRLNSYLDWSQWPLQTDVQWDNLLTIVSETPGIDKIKTFSPTNDTAVAASSLPKLASVSFIDATSAQATVLSGVTGDFPVV